MSAHFDNTPRVSACIEAVIRRFPSDKSTAYFEAVHQELAPLARKMEREVTDLRAALDQHRMRANNAELALHMARSSPAFSTLDERTLLAARAEGRAEAVLIVQSMDPEDALNDCMVGSGPCPGTGEYATHWDDDKLRAKFMVGDATINMETKAEMAYYEYQEARMVLEYEAMQRRDQKSVARAEWTKEQKDALLLAAATCDAFAISNVGPVLRALLTATPADTCATMRALCSNCGGTGAVHRVDGEYMGRCTCEHAAAATGETPP